jgi:hypothetical protein
LWNADVGYRFTMTDHPHQASSTDADPESQSTPAGVVRDLEDKAEELGASTEPQAPEPTAEESDARQ